MNEQKLREQVTEFANAIQSIIEELGLHDSPHATPAVEALANYSLAVAELIIVEPGSAEHAELLSYARHEFWTAKLRTLRVSQSLARRIVELRATLPLLDHEDGE